ncbi:ABC transporter permease [Chelatococcus asaccharovorans]|uniref:Nucleoside ABC transporter membrane protein n=1 Tax=Chelatococcus asaccharovorans TaxID=28210 RepID=A0A2V3U5F6_9HYPH|nr:ABC transporter permease [Chelatococcus asaccharovorans]MBS7703902.1 ABC transporter permease [Chelatococcus asaccharovorans]PXW58065.1 nucleoside ABC transporter membrane protein [Chelatococcus asaccharovorans]CAH1667803.1 Nucleoside ABC transporter membrane protein [Chelatococcus asaccharovorans]CAH1680663.1 Nucleoside ABC transporter membrane protein [Chelatococcus asaccharovorans]
MRIELLPRRNVSLAARILAPLAALAVSFVIGGLILAAMGRSPASAFDVYVVQSLSDGWALQQLALKATPLAIIAVGLSFCFRANLWNIGAEGQYIVGALCGGWIALITHGSDAGAWVLPAMLLAGIVGGALWALVAAGLKVVFGVSEILTSLMLVYVAEYWLDYLVRGPWRDPKGFNFPQTVTFDPSATLPMLGGELTVHAGVVIAIVVVLVAAFILRFSLFGYRLRVTGEAPRAARFAGFSPVATTLAVFAISGGLAGLAGVIEVSGSIGQLKPSISPGYGFTAIIVAFLGRLDPIGILIASLAMALTILGGEAAQIALRVPFDFTRAFQGILLIAILVADSLVTYRLRISAGRRAAA